MTISIFSQKLKRVIFMLGLTPTKIAELTGLPLVTVNDYILGERVPSNIEDFSRKIGVNKNYFNDILEEDLTVVTNVPVTTVAKLMHKSPAWVMKGLQDKVFPWG